MAGDGKYINSYAPSKKTEITNDDILDCRCETDATYSIKEKFYKDKDGLTKSKKQTYFGFRVHAIVDCLTELPVAYKVTPVNEGEGKHMKNMIPTLKNAKYLCLDKGYDDIKLINFCNENNIKPIIDKRTLRKDTDSTQYKNTNIYYYEDGTVTYYDEHENDGEGAFMPMKYLGYDSSRHALRYQYKNKIYRILIKEDPRVFNVVARPSEKI